LSAFTSNSTLYELTRNEFLKSLNAVTLTLRNPTFGTWNAIYSTLAKRIRSELNSGKAGRDLCAVLFSDPKLQIPQVITPKEIVPILERANELRNRRAHGALVSDRDARELEKTLVVLLQEFRNVTLDGWSRVDLIQPESCRVTSGRSLNTVSMLSGSHPGFLQTERQFASCLDSDYLYLSAKESQTALRLLSLFSLGAPPSSSRSAFYYFNGMDSVGTRFVSYHFADQSEIYLDNPEIQRDLRLIEQGLEIDFREDAEVGR
jgi:hypothetical protein